MQASQKRILTWSIAGLALAAGLVLAFRPQPVPVDLIEARRGDMVVTLDDEGETRVRDVFVVSSPVAGRVRRIEIEVGDPVASDTVIASIEPFDPAFLDPRTEAEAEAAVQAAEAALAVAAAELTETRAEQEFALSEVRRARQLIETGAIPQRQLDEAERSYKRWTAAIETSRAAYDVRVYELERARLHAMPPTDIRTDPTTCACVSVHSPVEGRVLRVMHESEGVIPAGEPLLEVGNPRDLEIAVDYLSTDAVRIEPGQRVVIDEWGGAAALEGRVRRVEPFGFTKVSALGIEEQRVNVIIDIVDPPDAWARLGHGYRVETRVVVWVGSDVIKVPLTALFRLDGENGEASWALYVAQDGQARLRGVTVGRRSGLEAVIESGLESGEMVLAYPSDQIADGVRVEARE